ncbi:DUF5518 domain-containing protein [Haloglomus salinum]|jgi:hypothetical protein|uniref:DUF5518 domain-containing protein n=1 Tax=Haloglomus salinum TaxID=2962673 RepID=UPI0020CA0067|nr:DUF5518 domain-containing protein [Haloglomus salinum]
MRSTDPGAPRLTPAWRYGLVGGLASIPLTAVHWLSETANELSLNMVFVGGLVAGYLAAVGAEQVRAAPVGVRTGLVGCLPGVWLALDTFLFGGSVGGPAWFQMLGTGMLVVSFIVFAVLVSIVIGVLGAKVGGWLAAKLGHRPTAVAGN